MAGFRTVLFTGKTAANTISVAQPCFDAAQLTIYLIGSGTISAGTLIVEESFWSVSDAPIVVPPGLTGWSQITPSTAPLDCTEVTGGLELAYQLPIGAYAYVRVRIGTGITGGGSISAALVGTV